MTSFWLPDETGFSYRNGALFCEDVPVTELADKYGTPSFIYSRKAIETATTTARLALIRTTFFTP